MDSVSADSDKLAALEVPLPAPLVRVSWGWHVASPLAHALACAVSCLARAQESCEKLKLAAKCWDVDRSLPALARICRGYCKHGYACACM